MSKKEQTQTWLTQSTVIAMMRYDYSLIQIKILVSIIEKFQSHILDAINNKTNVQLDLFASEAFPNKKDAILITVPIKDFGVKPNHYPLLKEALKLIASIPIETPIKDQLGRKWNKISSLCKAYYPDEGYVKNIILEMDKDVAFNLMDLTQGWHHYLKETVHSSTKKYTPRIYWMLCSWLNRGKFRISTKEFRKKLRLEGKYQRFSELEKRVLLPSQKELDTKFEKDLTNCSFKYNKIFKNGIERGDPDIIEFDVIKNTTPVGRRNSTSLKEIEPQDQHQLDLLNFSEDFIERWTSVISFIKESIDEDSYNVWFLPVNPLSYENSILTLRVPSTFVYEYLEAKYLDIIREALFTYFDEQLILNYKVIG